MKNKQAKQMIFDCVRKDRNLCWFGEDSEIFLAESESKLVSEFGYPDPDFPEDQYGLVKNPVKFMWELGYCDEKGVEPIINWAYGNKRECSQILSSYC
ncbi:hypothetical protein VPHK392_0055 [Vibrio phage K392]